MIRKKWFLYLTEFFSGMSVMAVELGASRLLAPYFSSSQIVWTLIIGTIMIAMALGNVFGGRLADKNKPDRLYLLLLIDAIWIGAIPFVGKYVIAGISFLFALFVKTNFLIWASLASCLLLFVGPCLILGMITPSLIKYAVRSLENNGRIVGELEALQTIGSIIGTFLPTFVTIPLFGTAVTFLVFASILLTLALIYFIAGRISRLPMASLSLLFVLLFVLAPRVNYSFSRENIVYEDESVYNYLRVEDTEDETILSTNVLFGVQSIKRKNADLTGLYYDYALGANYMVDADDPKMLILGMGSGTFASQTLKYDPRFSIEGVEIDRKIIDLTYKYFDLDPAVRVVEHDGRAYLSDAGLYDVIMVDAYQDITIPFQMSSVEFFSLVQKHLAPGGVMVVNLNMVADVKDNINDYLKDTVNRVFRVVYECPTDGTNCILFASDNEGIFDVFDARIATLTGPIGSMMGRVRERSRLTEKGNRVLTDDRAPVELLGMKALDAMIREELADLREQFRGKSLAELIELLR